MKKTIFILTLLLPFSLLVAQFNDSDVDQWGADNYVKVTQKGDLNTSNVFTMGDDNANSFVDQLGVGESNSNAIQIGDQNTVDVGQTNHYTKKWDLANSEIYQEGIDNHATVDQLVVNHPTNFFDGGPTTSDVYQFGDGNDAIVDQRGLWIDADIDQYGNNGVAKQYQGTTKYYNGKAYLSDAKIYQGVGVDDNSLAEQHQVGLQNDANIDQYSDDASQAKQLQINAKGTITGHRFIDVNQAYIKQWAGGDNRAFQAQFFNNKGVDPNIADVRQMGSGNWSREVQVGGDNVSSVHQFGDDNTSDVKQNSHNVADPTLLISNQFGLPH